MPTAITIEAISKSYGGGSPPAVDGVSLKIEPGELFFLLGPSGCGKTTLLRMIAGFIDPTAGRILFQKDSGEVREVTHLSPNHRNTGMVFQSYALWPHMTVAANVGFGLEVRKIPKDERTRRIAEALDLVQMGQYAQRKPNALSGGQQQRVALARALVVRPDVLLLDEPLSNLDAKLRVELRSEIRRICKSAAITTVYVTHDQKEALSMADRVAILRAGRIVQLGGPGDLYRAPASRFVAEFLGETNFLPATASGGALTTPFGTLRSAASAAGAVTLSLRPEALRLLPDSAGSTANALRGTIVDTTYLGEIAQHIVELTPSAQGAAAARLKVATLNPGPAAPRTGERVAVTVEPADVVVILES